MSTATSPGLDVDRLAARLGQGPLTVTPVLGGRSNLTYRLVSAQAGIDWVLRRPPLGAVRAGAHDMAREHRMTALLWPTAVPVPRPVHLCEDEAVLGAPFWIAEHVPGTVYREPLPLCRLGPGRVRAIAWSVVDTLAALHTLDPASVGLCGSDGFLSRQLERWAGLARRTPVGPAAAVLGLHERLARALPTGPAPSIVHGDYRLDNVLIRADRVAAVLDWELATVGDPLTDLGLLVAHTTRTDDLVPNPAQAHGHPDAHALIRRYALTTGADVSAIGWYVAFGFFKLASVAHDVHRRFLAGLTSGPGFADFDRLAASAAAQGHAVLREW